MKRLDRQFDSQAESVVNSYQKQGIQNFLEWSCHRANLTWGGSGHTRLPQRHWSSGTGYTLPISLISLTGQTLTCGESGPRDYSLIASMPMILDLNAPVYAQILSNLQYSFAGR